ncbi:MAG: hypothetical protein QM831_28485 [Kofleriaceae bacterium]
MKLWFAIAIAACQPASTQPAVQNCPAAPTHSCKAVVEKASAIQNLRAKKVTLAIGECEEQGWSEAVRSCLDGAGTKDAISACGTQYALKGDLFRTNDTRAVMAKMVTFKDQMCACKDSACASKVADDMTKWGQEEAKKTDDVPQMSDEDTKAFTKIGEEMGTCMQKAMGPGTP